MQAGETKTWRKKLCDNIAKKNLEKNLKNASKQKKKDLFSSVIFRLEH